MDLHRVTMPRKIDPQSGRPCQFCKRFDPEFGKRNVMDQLVSVKASDIAWSHLTEDGHIRHRLLELSKRMNAAPFLQNNSAA
jgi:hypothetical protein